MKKIGGIHTEQNNLLKDYIRRYKKFIISDIFIALLNIAAVVLNIFTMIGCELTSGQKIAKITLITLNLVALGIIVGLIICYFKRIKKTKLLLAKEDDETPQLDS